MGGMSRRWETRLWSYVSNGDSMHCPLINNCRLRQKGKWCADDNREKLGQSTDGGIQFDLDGCDCLEPYSGAIFPFVDKLAQKQLKKWGVRCPPVPSELVLLADERHSIEAHLVPLKVYHAAIWRLEDGWAIQLEDSGTRASNRLTLSHEVFHILAHCSSNATPVFSKIGTMQGYSNELPPDYFTICILMP